VWKKALFSNPKKFQLIDFQLYPRLLAVFRMQHWKEIKNILKSGNFLTNVCRQFANILPALSQKFHGLFFLKFHLTFVGCCKTPKVTSGNFEVFLVFWIGTTDLSKAKKTKILLQLWVFRPFPSKSGTFLKNIFLKLWSWSKFSVQNRFIQHACASLSSCLNKNNDILWLRHKRVFHKKCVTSTRTLPEKMRCCLDFPSIS